MESQGQPDNLDAYMHLGVEGIARLVLCLLIEEALQRRLACFRQNLAPEAVEGLEKLGIVRGDVVLVGNGLR